MCKYQDFVGILLDSIIVEGSCGWKLLSGNLCLVTLVLVIIFIVPVNYTVQKKKKYKHAVYNLYLKQVG
jgi:uncharacterized membrane protein